MASNVGLISLPVVVLGAVVEYLPLQDIRALRLSSSLLAAKVINTSFKAYFQTKSIALTASCLQVFVAVTRLAWISSALKHLTVICLDSQLRSQQDSQTWTSQASLGLLTEALANLRQQHNQGQVHLRSLTFKFKNDGAPYGPSKAPQRSSQPEAQIVWKLASDVAMITGQAVSASGLNIEALNLFASSERCALGSEHLKPVMEYYRDQQLKSLSLTVSASSSAAEDEGTTTDEGELSRALTHILHPMGYLERLEIRYFSLHTYEIPNAELEERNFLPSLVATSAALPHLVELSLKGIYTSQECLLSTLAAFPKMTMLTLESIHVTKGRFAPIFAYIDKEKRLDTVYLNDLYEDLPIQFLSASGADGFHPLGPPNWLARKPDKRRIASGAYPFHRDGAPTWLRRRPERRRRAIRYQQIRGVQKDSSAFSYWFRRQTLLYGPIR